MVSGTMSCDKKAKVKATSDVSLDRISSLPKEIKAIILSNLDVIDAIRANVLSSAWRNVWTIMPEMYLSDNCHCCGSSISSSQSSFITLVDLALSLHKGPLVIFSLLGSRSYHDVFDRWMYMLSRNEPSRITIKLTSGRKYKIPSSIFSIRDLEFLRLKNCIISLPPVFEGFKWLNVLKLKHFSSTDNDISNLITSCPLLNTLRLKYFEGIKSLSIQAPALEILEVEGNFEDLHLHTPNVVHLHLTLVETEAYQSVQVSGDRKGYLKQAFGSLTRVENLSVSGSFLTYLSKGCMRTKLPDVFAHLEKISLERFFWNWTEVLGASLLFQNAPTFKELEIWSFPRPEAFKRNKIWDQDQTEIQEPTLNHVVTVTLIDFMGLDSEVAFVGMLLNWAPALEELNIIRAKTTDGMCFCMCEGLMKLLALPRASNKAKIIVT